MTDVAQSTAARSEFAIHWPALATAMLGCALGASSLIFYSFGLFIEPLQESFGWSRGQVSIAFFFASGAMALSGPALGWLIDRIGVKPVALWSIPMFAATLVMLGQIGGSLFVFYGLFVVLALVGVGTTSILYTRLVNERFVAARGLALGLTLTGIGVAAILLPPLLSYLIGAYGWRSAFAALGALALLPWLFVLLVLPQERRATAAENAAMRSGASRKEALRSGIFWLLVASFVPVSIAVSALVVHMVPMLRGAGFDATQAAGLASLMGTGVVFGRVAVGWAVDRVFAPRVAAAVFIAAALGAAVLVVGGVTIAVFAILAAFLVGFALGAEVDLIAYMVARYFGMENYGFLYAVIYIFFAIGMAAGPAIAGLLFDRTGNYDLALWIVCGALLLGAALVSFLPRFPESPLQHRQP